MRLHYVINTSVTKMILLSFRPKTVKNGYWIDKSLFTLKDFSPKNLYHFVCGLVQMGCECGHNIFIGVWHQPTFTL